MKYITFILILCSTTLFSQGITIHSHLNEKGVWVSDTTPNVLLRSYWRNGEFVSEYGNPLDTFRLLSAPRKKEDMKYHGPVILDNDGWLQGMAVGRVHKDTLFTTGKLYGPSINEPGEIITGAEFITTPYGVNVLGEGVYFRSLPPLPLDLIPVTKYTEKYASNLYSTWVDTSYTDTIGWIMLDNSSEILTVTDSTNFVRDIQLPQAWADSTEWDAPYDPNFYFHKNHEWIYSEFDDLNQEYQQLHPYPLGGFEHQGRICKVCKTKQQRTKYYGVGKNPFKKVITNSPYSQLLLQSRQ